MSELLSQAEYAAHRGVSRAAVHKAARSGRIELTPDGRIDRDAADAAWLQNFGLALGFHRVRSAACSIAGRRRGRRITP